MKKTYKIIIIIVMLIASNLLFFYWDRLKATRYGQRCPFGESSFISQKIYLDYDQSTLFYVDKAEMFLERGEKPAMYFLGIDSNLNAIFCRQNGAVKYYQIFAMLMVTISSVIVTIFGMKKDTKR